MMKIKQIVWSIIVLAWIESSAYSSFDQEQAEAIFSRETLSLLQKKLVEINSQTYKTHRDRNRVLVLGPTGSGKSTLVTYLAGISLKVGQKSSGQKTLIAEAQLPDIEIGDGALAQTKVPAAWIDEDNDVVYWDCPGFLDTEGPAQEISNAAMIHKVVYNEEKRTSDPVKILFVVPYEYVADEEGTCFRNQLSRVTGMFPDEQLSRSLYLVVTQARHGISIKNRLLELLDNLQRPDAYMETRNLSIIRSLRTRVASDLFYNFPKPDPSSIIGSDYVTNRDAIDRVLYAEHLPLRVALNLSQEASEYIGRLCAACQDHLISQFRRQGPEIIKNHFTQKMQREEYDEVRDQIERLRTLEATIREMNSFVIAERLEEFVGSSVKLEIEKTLHILEALRNLEGFQGVDINSLMRNLLRTVFPEVIRTIAEQLTSNIGRYITTQGRDELRELQSSQLLNWYNALEAISEVNFALEKFQEIADTEHLRRHMTMVEYLRTIDDRIGFLNQNIIAAIKNAYAPYIVSILQNESKDQHARVKELEIQAKIQSDIIEEIKVQKIQLEEECQRLIGRKAEEGRQDAVIQPAKEGFAKMTTVFQQLFLSQLDLTRMTLEEQERWIHYIGQYTNEWISLLLHPKLCVSDNSLLRFNMHNIHEMTISDGDKLTDNAFVIISEQCKRLRILKASGLSNVQSLSQKEGQGLPLNFPYLENLDVSNQSQLRNITLQAPHLKVLLANRCIALMQIGLMGNELEDLDLEGCIIFDKASLEKITKDNYLKSLTVEGCSQFETYKSVFRDINDVLTAWYISAVNNESERRFLLEQYRLARNQRELQIWNKNIGDEKAVALARIVEKVKLRSLDTSEDRIGEKGGVALGRMIENNKTLEKVSLRSNYISNSAAEAIGRALISNVTLTDLALNGNSIGSDGAVMLAIGLETNRTLKRLLLGGNNIGIQGGIAFGKMLAINNTLEELFMDKTGMADEGCIGFSDGLQRNTKIKTLLLECNTFTDLGGSALERALEQNETVVDLRLLPMRIGITTSSYEQTRSIEAARAEEDRLNNRISQEILQRINSYVIRNGRNKHK